MEHKLECEIIRDLLPSYVDGLTGDATNKAIEEHLSGCADCSAVLKRMKEPELQGEVPALELDYLKKVRRRSTGKSLLIGISLMILGMALLFYRYFYVGNELDASELYCHVSVEGDTMSVSGTIAGSSGLGVSRVVFSDSAGIVQMKVYAAPKTFFNSGDFDETYTVPAAIGQVCAGELILWDAGVEISPMTARLFAATNPYVGDMPSNNRIAALLGISDQFGPYTNELQTTKEPYGWTLILETPIASGEEQIAREIMAKNAYVMLASIENLSYVTWRYDNDAGLREYTVTAADANAFAGRDVKGFADSAAELQNLLQSLGFQRFGMREVFQQDRTFFLNIRNDSGDAVYGIMLEYYLDGKAIGSRGFINADNSALERGEEASFDFRSEDFPDDTAMLYGFSFDLSVIDKDGNAALVSKDVSATAKYAWTYPYTLSGDFTNGFILNEG